MFRSTILLAFQIGDNTYILLGGVWRSQGHFVAAAEWPSDDGKCLVFYCVSLASYRRGMAVLQRPRRPTGYQHRHPGSLCCVDSLYVVCAGRHGRWRRPHGAFDMQGLSSVPGLPTERYYIVYVSVR